MFKDKKDEEKEKLRKKVRKHAIQEQLKEDMKRKEAEKIKDDEYVQKKLAEEKLKDEMLMKKRDEIVKQNIGNLLKTIEHFKCKACGSEVELENLTCPVCGQLYCQYCGSAMDMENPGICPKCGGVPFYQPAELVLTRVEDLPPEERFWETLPECPKCHAAVQPDWPECPLCGQKLEGKGSLEEGKVDEGIWTEEDLAEMQAEEQPKSPKEIAREKRRKEKMEKGERGV